MTQVSPSALINQSISPLNSKSEAIEAKELEVENEIKVDDKSDDEENFYIYGGVPTGGGYLPESDTGTERTEKKPAAEMIPVPVAGEDFEQRKPRVSRRPMTPTKADIEEHFRRT